MIFRRPNFERNARGASLTSDIVVICIIPELNMRICATCQYRAATAPKIFLLEQSERSRHSEAH